MWDIKLGSYIDSPPDCLGMMTIKEKMFNDFVTITEITLLTTFLIPLD
jgi:hypothetical protein